MSVEPAGGAPAPPNSTYLLRVESNASAAAIRACGPMSWRSVQCRPFHCQVPPNGTIGLDVAMPPPKSSTVYLSHSADAASAAGGPKCATSVQAAPSHAQVSASTLLALSAPPNRTTCSRTASYASPFSARATGPVSATCVHS